jgi:soluble lytic murein transglycosylase-like protein
MIPWSCCWEAEDEMAVAPPNPYESYFKESAARTQHVKWWLLAGMGYETSHFRAEARGAAGEYGIMQVMPANAPTCGVAAGDLADARTNILCGGLLLQRQFDHVYGAGGIASWADAAKFAMFSNNMGWGNTAGKLDAISAPRTWAKFKAAWGDAYPGKIEWVEQMWARAEAYRGNDWLNYGVIAASVAGALALLYFTVR